MEIICFPKQKGACDFLYVCGLPKTPGVCYLLVLAVSPGLIPSLSPASHFGHDASLGEEERFYSSAGYQYASGSVWTLKPETEGC